VIRNALVLMICIMTNIDLHSQSKDNRFEVVPTIGIAGAAFTDKLLEAGGPAFTVKGQFVVADVFAIGARIGGCYWFGSQGVAIPLGGLNIGYKFADSVWIGIEYAIYPALTIGLGKSEILLSLIPLYGGSFKETIFEFGYGYKF